MSKKQANPKAEKNEVTHTPYTVLKTYRLLCAKFVLTKALKEHAIPGAWSSVEDQNLWTLAFETIPSLSVTSMNIVRVLPSSFASTFHQMITLAGGMEEDKSIAIPGPVPKITGAFTASSVGGRNPANMRDGGGIKAPHADGGGIKTPHSPGPDRKITGASAISSVGGRQPTNTRNGGGIKTPHTDGGGIKTPQTGQTDDWESAHPR